MRRHIPLLAALALAVSMSCTPGATISHGKMGAVGPPPGRTIPFGYDPSVSGLSGAEGEVVYNNGGLTSWVRFGVNNTDWQPFPGSGGGATVTTDGTLSGNGSVGSPLGINPTAARAPDWSHYVATLFQQKTGLSPLDWKIEYVDTHSQYVGGGSSPELRTHGFSATGTGAAVVRSSTYPGAIQLTSASTGTPGSVYSIWSQDDTSSNNFCANPRTRRWAAFFRLAVASAPGANSQVSGGIRTGSTYLGVGYVGNAGTWRYVRGAAGSQTNITDTGVAIDSSGTKWITVYVGNFDLANIVVNVDVRAGLPDVVAEAVGSIPASLWSGALLNDGTGSDVVVMRDILIACELPTAGTDNLLGVPLSPEAIAMAEPLNGLDWLSWYAHPTTATGGPWVGF